MRKVQIKKKLYMQISTMILCVVALTTLYSVNAFAKSEKNAVVGKVYEFVIMMIMIFQNLINFLLQIK